jgi:hypothetical protein
MLHYYLSLAGPPLRFFTELLVLRSAIPLPPPLPLLSAPRSPWLYHNVPTTRVHTSTFESVSSGPYFSPSSPGFIQPSDHHLYNDPINLIHTGFTMPPPIPFLTSDSSSTLLSLLSATYGASTLAFSRLFRLPDLPPSIRY